MFIIGSSFLVLTEMEPVKRIETIVYGYVAIALQAYAIDTLLSGNKQSIQVIIFSKKFEEIADKISLGRGRGATVLDGMGWFTKENQKVIITLVRKHEASDLYRMIKEIDNNAFISVSNVMGVYGKGFEQIRH